jgi:hypothetical protein
LLISAISKLVVAYIVYLTMLFNSLYLKNTIVGIIGFCFFVLILGKWVGKIYGAHTGIVNFLIGCFILLSVNILVMGFIVYLMVFSAFIMWIFYALIPVFCYILEINFLSKETRNGKNGLTYSLMALGLNRTSSLKLSVLGLALLVGFIMALLARTGNGISTIGQVISFGFWPIVGFCFFMLYMIWKDQTLSVDLKLICMFLVAFLIFGVSLVVYRNYITEDSFGLLGDVRSIIQTGIYGWVPHLARTGYFALFSTVTISTSTFAFVGDVYKIVSTLLVSVFAPLFIYLILEKITKKKPTYAVLFSIFLFPTLLFLSVPLEKSIATLFFLGTIWLSLLLVENSTLRKADFYLLLLILLAAPFLHDYFGLFASIPVILALFLVASKFEQNKRCLLLLFAVICISSILIPSSFVVGSYFTHSNPQITFTLPRVDSIIGFLMPAPKLAANLAWDGVPYVYSDNFMWVRYIFLIFGAYVLGHSVYLQKKPKTKVLLIATVITFWIGYFLLKTCVQNPPEEAKDYRFGFFVDLSLIPIVGIMIIEGFEKLRNQKIQFNLPRILKPKPATRLAQITVAIILITIIIVSIFCGFNFDRIMERPSDAQGIGRYVVKDYEIELMHDVQNMSADKKYVVLTDSHLAQVAQGVLDLNFANAELFNLNSGGALNTYFSEMRHDPSRSLMNALMNKTNADIGFFVIGLEDWRGWQPEGAYWIDSNAIQTLKTISDEWRVFGENDTFVFVFQN